MKIETIVKCTHCGKELNLENIFSQQSDIYNILKKIMLEDGDNNFIIIALNDDYFLQAAAYKETNELIFEAVSNKFLSPEKCLNEIQQNGLVNLGWKAPDSKHENYYFGVDFISDKSLIGAVELITKTAREIYGVNEINHKMLTINIE
jgi:hypothetical protein